MIFLVLGRRTSILPQSEEAPMERAVNPRGGENRVAQGTGLQTEHTRDKETKTRRAGSEKSSAACGLPPCMLHSRSENKHVLGNSNHQGRDKRWSICNQGTPFQHRAGCPQSNGTKAKQRYRFYAAQSELNTPNTTQLRKPMPRAIGARS